MKINLSKNLLKLYNDRISQFFYSKNLLNQIFKNPFFKVKTLHGSNFNRNLRYVKKEFLSILCGFVALDFSHILMYSHIHPLSFSFFISRSLFFFYSSFI